MKEQESIWVSKEFAEKYEAMKSPEKKIEMFDGYIKGLMKESKEEFKSNLKVLDEDVAIYTGLMLRVKRAFEKAKNEQLSASYELWEKFEKELPSISKKIKTITDKLNPLIEKLENVEKLLGKINSYRMEDVIKTVERMTSLYGKEREMIDFLVKNFGETKGVK